MVEIKDLLARFNNLLVSGEFKKEMIREVISKAISVDIKSNDIEIKNGTVYLNIKPIYKNEIFIKREKIDALLENALGKKTPKDLR